MATKRSTKIRQKNFIFAIMTLLIFFPCLVSAHLISITPTRPFPGTVAALTSSVASFKITNISSGTLITAINQSTFPPNSGLTIASSTCGQVLRPGQFCVIQLGLNAGVAGSVVAGELKIWAKPTADGVRYPFQVRIVNALPQITLLPVNINSNLPALRDPVVATHHGLWLIVSGSLNSFHDFNNNFNTSLYVYNPRTTELFSLMINSTNLPLAVRNQLASSDTMHLQVGDTLYIVGGFYTPDNIFFTTLNTVTAINIPGMINAIIQGETNVTPFVNVNTTIPQFKVTGGQLGRIGNYFYLVFGQDCEGPYCATSQVYTNSIYKFTIDPTLSSITIVDSATHLDSDGSGWRRRDYTLAPFMVGQTQTLFALGGPFTPGNNALAWTNGILVKEQLQSNNHFINQQGNQYLAPHVTFYSAHSRTSYVATFSGLSNLYWAVNGLLYNNFTPYGNVLDLITADATGHVEEYVNTTPLCSGSVVGSCLYMGLTAKFISAGNYYNDREILQLDQLPQNTPTLIGYIYGGLLSPVQDIFGTNQSYVTNRVYAVYVTPKPKGSVQWLQVTNLFPGVG